MSEAEVVESPPGAGVLAKALAAFTLLLGAAATAVPQPAITPPQPTVPEVFTLMGQFVRVAYNDRGFVSLGYRIAQESVGQEWMLLDVGLTMRAPARDYAVKREDVLLKTPDGRVIGLATQKEYAAADYLLALNRRANVARSAIDYFPADVKYPCRIPFFVSLGVTSTSHVELGSAYGCVGRLYFRQPGGIRVGQHWLVVGFGESEVQVPFRILTKEEEKELRKTWKDLKKAHDASYER